MHDEPTTKVNFFVQGHLLDEFTTWTKRLGLKRDHYLNEMLPETMRQLRVDQRPTSPEQKKLQRLIRKILESKIVRMRVTVQVKTLDDLNALCADREFSRDQVIEGLISNLIRRMSSAEDALFNYCPAVDTEDAFAVLFGTKEDAESETKRIVKQVLGEETSE